MPDPNEEITIYKLLVYKGKRSSIEGTLEMSFVRANKEPVKVPFGTIECLFEAEQTQGKSFS